MAQITTYGDFRFRRRPAFSQSLVLGFSFGLAWAFAGRGEARAASIATSPNPGSAVLGHPFVLDQNGQPIVAANARRSHAVVLAPNAVPTYLTYRLPSSASAPSGIPTIRAGSGGKPQFTPLVQTQLSRDLAQYGEAAVSSGNRAFLVKPLPAVLGASGGTAAPQGTSHAWRAAPSTRRSELASKSESGSTASTSKGTSRAASTTGSSVPTTTQAQTIIPTNILNPVANSKLIKDMEHLLTVKSGKLVNWNPQTLNTLRSDLALGSPKNVAPQLTPTTTTPTPTTTTTTKPVYEAQVLAGIGSSAASVQPTPAPEPGTLVVFGLAAVALVWRLRSRQQEKIVRAGSASDGQG